MGTTLQAQLERFIPEGPFRKPGWDAVSRWEFGKDYTASIALHNSEHATYGWPEDSRKNFEEEEWECFDQDRQTIDTDYLPIVDDPTLHWQSFVASLAPLIANHQKLRVLFWRM